MLSAMLPNRSNDTGTSRIASDRKVMKTTEEGENRKGGRIERWRRGGRSDGDTGEEHEHMGKNVTKVTNIS